MPSKKDFHRIENLRKQIRKKIEEIYWKYAYFILRRFEAIPPDKEQYTFGNGFRFALGVTSHSDSVSTILLIKGNRKSPDVYWEFKNDIPLFLLELDSIENILQALDALDKYISGELEKIGKVRGLENP